MRGGAAAPEQTVLTTLPAMEFVTASVNHDYAVNELIMFPERKRSRAPGGIRLIPGKDGGSFPGSAPPPYVPAAETLPSAC